MYELQDPFLGLSTEQRIQRLQEVVETSRARVEVVTDELERLVRSSNPLVLLSISSNYSLLGFMDNKGHVTQNEHSLTPAQLEFLQAVVLRQPVDAFNMDQMPSPSECQQVFDLVRELFHTEHMRSMAKLPRGTSEDEVAAEQLVRMLQAHTRAVRNWGYFHHMEDITERLTTPLRTEVVDDLGVTVLQMARLLKNLLLELQTRLGHRFDRLRRALAGSDTREILESYYREFPGTGGSVEEMMERCAGMEPASLREFMMSYTDLDLCESLTFTSKDLAELAGDEASLDAVASLANLLSLTFGDLSDQAIPHILLDNPVSRKPLVAIGEDEWLLPNAVTPMSSFFRILDEVLRSDPKLKRRYERRKAEFLEEEAARLLSSVLRGSKCYPNIFWTDPETGKRHETDLLIIYEGTVVIVEAKAHKVTREALRGHPDRVKRQVEELIEHPSTQSQRLEQLVRTSPAQVVFSNERGKPVDIDVTGVRRVLRLSVILEDFGTIQTRPRDLVDAGLIKPGVVVAPTMLLSDLRVVTEILDTPGLLLHYLWRRTHFSQNARYFGDELDLLGTYLDLCLEMGEAECNGSMLGMTGMSKSVDDYFTAGEGMQRVKPHRRMVPWWQEVVAAIECRQKPGWIESLLTLLSFPFESQQELMAGVKTLTKAFGRRHKTAKNNLVCAVSGPPQDRQGLILLAYTSAQVHERRAIAENACYQLFEDTDALSALVIGIEVDSRKHPYAFSLFMV